MLKGKCDMKGDSVNNSSALLGASLAIRNAKSMVTKSISSDASVLIVGENGTGKNDVAHFIHNESQKGQNQFVTLSCSSIQETNLERELKQAQNGTLFFEDIDKLSPRLQFVFFKVLQDFFTPQNPSSDQSKKIRLMASATTDLENFVRRGFFREDLYLKFSGLTIYLPALKERRDDIPYIVNHYIQKTNKLKGTKITSVASDTMKVLLQHTWPNNIHELEILIERIALLKNSGQIEICDLPPRLRSLVTNNIDTFYTQSPTYHVHAQPVVRPEQNITPKPVVIQTTDVPSEYDQECTAIDQFVKKEINLGNGIDFYRIVEAFENRLLQAALVRAQHNKNKAAQLLSMNRTTLVEKLRKRSMFAGTHNSAVNKEKYHSGFTIMDELGIEQHKPLEKRLYMTITND